MFNPDDKVVCTDAKNSVLFAEGKTYTVKQVNAHTIRVKEHPSVFVSKKRFAPVGSTFDNLNTREEEIVRFIVNFFHEEAEKAELCDEYDEAIENLKSYFPNLTIEGRYEKFKKGDIWNIAGKHHFIVEDDTYITGEKLFVDEDFNCKRVGVDISSDKLRNATLAYRPESL